MDSPLRAILTSWSLLPEVLALLLVVAGIYVRGWRLLPYHGRWRPTRRHLACFLGGLATIYVAIASPIDPFGSLLLSVHMAQHVLLMFLAPPLIWLGAPELPLLRGLPSWVRRNWVRPLINLPPVRAAARFLTQPKVAWPIFVVVLWVWHAPQLYELALESQQVHYLEHACFFWTGMLFWWPVIRPYPARPRFSTWALLPYLFLAGVQGTVLSALLTFSNRVLYPHYEQVPRLWGISALIDQAVAGAVMWIPGSLAFLIPLAAIGVRLLYGHPRDVNVTQDGNLPRVLPAHRPGRPRFYRDLLMAPVLGRFLRWRHARPAMQLPVFVLGALVILDGFWGPQVAPLNLAGVLPWIYWRGILILGLLAFGNVCCMVCPFMLLRGWGRRFLPGNRPWPRWLPGKWAAVALIVLFFWGYEAGALWDSPFRTACIATAYFAGAVVIDGIFRGAAFCKHVCPIGQFNFVQSLASPYEVHVRDRSVCRRCTTQDCIRGRRGMSGCETYLFQPYKAGNMDCMFCFNCIRACPHDNVGILPRIPAAELRHYPLRSGIGRFSRRTDLAVMVVALVAAAFVNASGMIGPVIEFENRTLAAWRLSARWPLVTLEMFLGLLVIPAVAVAAATLLSRWLSRVNVPRFELARQFSYTLVPLGFGMWLAHYLFHLGTGLRSIVPAAGRFLADLGLASSALAGGACCTGGQAGDRLLILEILCLDAGLLFSLYAAYRLAEQYSPGLGRRLQLFGPWAALMVALFALGVWILFQPMQMRGVMMMNPGTMP
jgi:cytochrome c oxidase assembly factor CtaG